MCEILLVDGVKVANVLDGVRRRCFGRFDYDINRVSFMTVDSPIYELAWIDSELEFERILIQNNVSYSEFSFAYHGFMVYKKTKNGGFSKKPVMCFYAFTNVRSAYWSDSLLQALNSLFLISENKNRYVYDERKFLNALQIVELGVPVIDTITFSCSHEF